MNLPVGKFAAWLLVVVGVLVNGALVWQAATLGSLTGAGAAQADLGLYLVLRTIGLPVVVVSLLVVIVTFVIAPSKKVAAYNRGVAVVASLNCVVPVAIWFWLTTISKQ